MASGLRTHPNSTFTTSSAAKLCTNAVSAPTSAYAPAARCPSAAGRSAEEIPAELTRRLGTTPEEEVRAAAEEHRRITRLRLERMLG